VFLDPFVLPRSIHPASAGTGLREGVFLAGASCLERDLVLRHRVFVDRRPEPGDLVVFVNTAAYQMDLSASQALMHAQPARIAVEVDTAPAPDTTAAGAVADAVRVRSRPDAGSRSGSDEEEWVWPSSTR
jgi:hypothetical protein